VMHAHSYPSTSCMLHSYIHAYVNAVRSACVRAWVHAISTHVRACLRAWVHAISTHARDTYSYSHPLTPLLARSEAHLPSHSFDVIYPERDALSEQRAHKRDRREQILRVAFQMDTDPNGTVCACMRECVRSARACTVCVCVCACACALARVLVHVCGRSRARVCAYVPASVGSKRARSRRCCQWSCFGRSATASSVHGPYRTRLCWLHSRHARAVTAMRARAPMQLHVLALTPRRQARTHTHA
jgi:hypothetical protein